MNNASNEYLLKFEPAVKAAFTPLIIIVPISSSSSDLHWPEIQPEQHSQKPTFKIPCEMILKKKFGKFRMFDLMAVYRILHKD